MHDVRKRVVPALDDEFAKDMGEFDTLDALRARVRQDLEAEATEALERQVRADVLKKLAGACRSRCRGRSSIVRSIAASRSSRVG